MTLAEGLLSTEHMILTNCPTATLMLESPDIVMTGGSGIE